MPTFSRLQQSMIPPTATSTPTTTSNPSAPLLLLPCICIFANTGPFYSHLPKQIRVEGRASTVRAVRLSALPCRMVTKKKKGQEKELSLREHNPTEWLSVNDKCEKKKNIHRQFFQKSVTFSEAERVGSPSFLGPCNPTSTSPLAERNMQTHFIDFWSFAEKPNWTFLRHARASARAHNKPARGRGAE